MLSHLLYRAHVSFRSGEDAGVGVTVIDALAAVVVVLAEIEIEREVEHHHVVERVAECVGSIWRGFRQVHHILTVMLRERIHHHCLQRPLAAVVAYGYGMQPLALADCFSPQFVVARVHLRHRHPLLVHTDYASAKTEI